MLTRNLQTVLLNWGLADLDADKLDDAGEHLQRAAQLGERAEVLRAQGVVYVKQAKYARATAALEQALQMAPKDPQALLALADVYLKQDKRPQALELLQRAKEAGARGPGVGRDGAAAEPRGRRRVGLHAAAEPPLPGQLRRRRRPQRACAWCSMRSKMPTTPSAASSITTPTPAPPVVLYTQQDFHAVTQTPDWAGAAFDGRIKLPVRGLSADDPEFQRVVRHEYAHSLVAQLAGPRCPVWLNEGLAVWAEEDRDGDHEQWAEHQIADQELFRLDQLNGSFTTLPAGRVDVAYAESYLAVRALVDRYGARKHPEAARRPFAQGHNFAEAFAAVYPGDFAGFERDLLRQIG